MKGDRLVIPTSLHSEVLKQLHYPHQGVEKCKLRTKGSIFCAGINKDIGDMAKACAPCQKNQLANSKEPLIPRGVPLRAWHTLGTDIFYWNNSHYLLLIDYYSKLPIIRKLSFTRSSS